MIALLQRRALSKAGRKDLGRGLTRERARGLRV
jgi:hypothetical protein